MELLLFQMNRLRRKRELDFLRVKPLFDLQIYRLHLGEMRLTSVPRQTWTTNMFSAESVNLLKLMSSSIVLGFA